MAEKKDKAFMQFCVKCLNEFLDDEFGTERNWSDLSRRTDVRRTTIQRLLEGKFDDTMLSTFTRIVQGTGMVSKRPDLILEILNFPFDDHSPDEDEKYKSINITTIT